ncbi:MAG: panE [Firmicutes bacterium]|nr:panE [Bacillota bacterium]
MKIAVIGAGAMGSLYGGYLSKVSEEVYLVDVWQQHVDAINKNGLIVEGKDRETVVYPKAVSSAEEIGYVDLALIFVKSTITGSALEKNKAILGPDTIVLSLQNGYGNVEQMAEYVNINNIIAGTTAHGSTMLAPGHIKHAGKGETHIGWVQKRKDGRIDSISDILSRAGFETIVSDNVMELIWSKLIINVGINALSAILNLKNGELLIYDETKELMRMAILEAVKTAKAAGIDFDEEEMVKKVMNIAFATGENKSSMLQDILNKRKTEIDTINGAIVKVGVKHSVETPVNVVLTTLVKTLEKTR